MIHSLEADSIILEFDQRKILSDVYLKCEKGKVTGLLGRNGQGKSSLMKIIYGTLDCGKSVRFDGEVYYHAYKNPNLLRFLPQKNFIPTALELNRVFRDFELEFSTFEQRFPYFSGRCRSSINNLSGGERRLVEVYIILMSNTQFAMLDEPFTHLNPVMIEKVKELMQEEKQRKGILITDHMYKHVMEMSEDLYLLSNGKTYPVTERDELKILGYIS
jgi:ABC-type lipopolysaccharide export system ATPase subunit